MQDDGRNHPDPHFRQNSRSGRDGQGVNGSLTLSDYQPGHAMVGIRAREAGRPKPCKGDRENGDTRDNGMAALVRRNRVGFRLRMGRKRSWIAIAGGTCSAAARSSGSAWLGQHPPGTSPGPLRTPRVSPRTGRTLTVRQPLSDYQPAHAMVGIRVRAGRRPKP